MLGDGTKKNFKTMLAEAKLPERTVQVCLRGDLVAAHEEAERQLEQAQKAQSDSLAGSGVGELADRIEALEAEMHESAVTFTLRAMARSQWRELMNSHPPRRKPDSDDVVDEDLVGLNVETFYPDLIRRCLVDPELDDEDWTALLDVLTSRQYDEIAGAAWAVNRHEVDIPFSPAASRAKRASASE
jgi:uncharacterized small protein (DUF1192 family)